MATGEIETELSRDMGLFDITFIGVGAMIGAGVFALTGFAAGIAGPALTVAFVLNGFVALFTAVSYAELGAAFPEAGGGYLWVKEALVEPNGFFAGWMSWFAHAVACSLYAVTFGVFLTEFAVVLSGAGHEFVLFGFVTRLMVEKLLAALMVVAFAYINYRGAEETGKAGIIVTGMKVLILGLFVVFGILATVSSPNWTDKFLSNPSFAPNGLFGILGAMGFTYIAFEGYEIIVQSGEEVVEPGKNIPKAVFYSLLIVVPIYVLVSFAAIGGIDPTKAVLGMVGLEGSSSVYTWQLLGELGELGIIRAAGLFVPYGVPLLLVAGLAATMSALNATIYSSGRVSFAMGRDRALPPLFSSVHEEKRTPHWAILLSAILIIGMAISLPIESVAASADIMFILLFIQVNWTLIRMRKTHPDLSRTYKVPYMPYPPLVGIALQLILTPFLLYELGLAPGQEGFFALVTTIIWMFFGLAVYYGYSEEKEKLEEETPAVVEERAPVSREKKILLPVARPNSVEGLMSTALDLARFYEAEIRVMSVVRVPQQTPLSEGWRFVDRKREVLRRAIDTAEGTGVPVSGTIRIGHDVSQAILNTVEKEEPDTLLMGWRSRPRRAEFILGSTVDPVVTRAQCDVLVEKLVEDIEEINSVLVPTAGGPHSDLSAEIAKAVSAAHGSEVKVVHVASPGADEGEIERARGYVEKAVSLIGEGAEGEVLIDGDVCGRIVREGEDFDLLILGAAREPFLRQVVVGAVPERVSSMTDKPVIMAKSHIPVRERLRGLASSLRRFLMRPL